MNNLQTKKQINCLVILLLGLFTYAQVGIGTTIPDASAILDISSTESGLLTPRMTTTQRNAIVSPAEGLLVYDTTLSGFYFYKSTGWLEVDASLRENYKLIKSVADLSEELTAGGGSKYLLTSDVVYEINGTISLAYPIDINDAYITGIDSSDDILVKVGGTMFEGSKGGVIKNITVTAPGGTIFNLNGTSAENLVFKDANVVNSNDIGTIANFNLIYFSVLQYVNNTSGITFNSITDLLLSNIGWQDSNSGSYETYTGTFKFIQKQGGFMSVSGANVGIDVSSNPTVSTAVLTGVSFNGTATQYVNPYTTNTFPNYNFTNSWTVNCPGIPVEADEVSTGNIYYDGTITSGFIQDFTNGSPINLRGNSNANSTTLVNSLRTSSPQDNRITYLGKKTRTFQVNAALSVRGNSGVGDFYAFFIKKNGTTLLTETNTLMRVNDTSDISSNCINGTVELAPNDYIEIWGQRLTGTGTTSITVFSLNLILN
ncbi:MAG: hypothetical protein HKN40_04285 [Winogradskyella sp.]|uniref:hypothetical protein n=1 Tax=Winogradskyella sp. TaxID=1883156 RepID=UPI0017DB8926|nr:hypothetical protein [Winogradskyella sp.]